MIIPCVKRVILSGLIISFLSCKKETVFESLPYTTDEIVDTTNLINITIDEQVIKNDISKQYKGINITDNWENQSYWKYPIAPATTIKEIGSNIIRTGNDDVFWSEPPYAKPKPRLINYGPNEYLSTQTDLVESDGIHLKNRYLNIDEYVKLCRASNNEPEIIIPYNRIYYKGSANSNTTTKEDFLKNAESMVKYANKIKGYHIKFWEIGNESWQPSTNVTAENYANDLNLFSERMKAVDPSIKIIANGNSTAWFQTVIAGAAKSIDYINISYYPTYSYYGYDFYKNNNIFFDTDDPVTNALQALSSTKNYSDKNSMVATDKVQATAVSASNQNIKLIVTEFNAAGFYGQWKDNNDLAHALLSFQIGADLMSNPQIYFSSFWNLRWYYGYVPNNPNWLPLDTNPATVYNAANNQGKLNPNGTSLAILYNNSFGAMVDAKSDDQLIRPYACYDKNSGKKSIFLINKSSSKQAVKINFKKLLKLKGEIWVFTGTSETDTNPTWKKTKFFTSLDDSAILNLDALSITLIKM